MAAQTVIVRLEMMTEKEYEMWSEKLIEEYAQDHVEAGNWSAAEALERSRKDVESLLPDGVHTEKHFLYRVTDETTKEKVGFLWLAVRDQGAEKRGFIYDLEIEAAYRRMGYATAAMLALEVQARLLSIQRLGLHVFAHNPGAQALYEKLGYLVTDISMAKQL